MKTGPRGFPIVPVLVAGIALSIVSSCSRATAPEAGSPAGQEAIEGRFPGYQPKATPDTAADYRPGLSSRLAELPQASLGSLPRLIAEISRMQALARNNPGRWEDGSIPLGGDPKEYRPSDEELLVSDLGERIERVVAAERAGSILQTLSAAGIRIKEVVYGRILFRHADVMGSGRFFYASPPIQTTIALRQPVTQQ